MRKHQKDGSRLVEREECRTLLTEVDAFDGGELRVNGQLAARRFGLGLFKPYCRG